MMMMMMELLLLMVDDDDDDDGDDDDNDGRLECDLSDRTNYPIILQGHLHLMTSFEDTRGQTRSMTMRLFKVFGHVRERW